MGDLKYKLNNGNIWITNFYLSGFQVVVRYLDHHSNDSLNIRPFDDKTTLDHLNIRLVQYSFPTVHSKCPKSEHLGIGHISTIQIQYLDPHCTVHLCLPKKHNKLSIKPSKMESYTTHSQLWRESRNLYLHTHKKGKRKKRVQ